MKTKKHQKNRRLSPCSARLWDSSAPALFRIKFDTSTDNISCFIGKKSPYLQSARKKSNNFSHQKKQSSKKVRVNSIAKQSNSVAVCEGIKKRDPSLDIVKQSSNIILSKIEEKGINCIWNENEEAQEVNDETDVAIWSAFDVQSAQDKSFASTNDIYHCHSATTELENSYTATPAWSSMLGSEPVAVNPFEVQGEYIQRDWRTTLMIRNIPNKYTISDLAAQIDVHLPETYDFLYLPCDFKNQCNVGYGFINFIDTVSLESFYYLFHSYHWKKYKSEKICALTYARLQGLNQLIEHFENSKVLNQKDKKYRPIIKYKNIHKIVLEQQKRQ